MINCRVCELYLNKFFQKLRLGNNSEGKVPMVFSWGKHICLFPVNHKQDLQCFLSNSKSHDKSDLSGIGS